MTKKDRKRYEDAKKAYAALIKYYPLILDDLDGEQWRPILGYDGYHESNYGRTKSLKYKKPRIMRPALDSGGYLIISLSKANRQKTFRVNRLVALCFIPNPDNKPQVDHRYGMKFDNYFENLRWVTSAENVKYAFNIGKAITKTVLLL